MAKYRIIKKGNYYYPQYRFAFFWFYYQEQIGPSIYELDNRLFPDLNGAVEWLKWNMKPLKPDPKEKAVVVVEF